MNLRKITPTGKAVNCSVNDKIFAAPVNKPLIAQAVRVFRSNQRQGTSKVKSRSEVIRTKAKAYRQKGTGRARHGSRNAPIFVGGGVAHGPSGNQNWSLTLSKQQKRAALISALSLQNGQAVVSDIPLETSGKTKYAAQFIKSLGSNKSRYLLIYAAKEDQVKKPFINIPAVTLRSVAKLSTYEVIMADVLIFTSQAITELERRLIPEQRSKSPVKKERKASPKKTTVREVAKSTTKSAPKKTKSPSKAKTVRTNTTTKKSAATTRKKVTT